MNLLGKILTLLILVMSLLFLFVAFMVAASHQNWKQQAETNKQLADERLVDKNAVQAEIIKYKKLLEQEKVSRTLMLAQLESQWQAAKREYEAKEKELISALASLEIKTKTVASAEARIKEQDGQVAVLDEQIKNFIENIAEEHRKVIELQTQVFESRGTVESLERKKVELANSFAMATKVLKSVGLTELSLTDAIPPIRQGRVRSIDRDLIGISLGADDGIKVGHTIDIFDGSKFKASAKITNVENNQAVARLIPSMNNSAVEVMDQVTTEWSRPVALNNN